MRSFTVLFAFMVLALPAFSHVNETGSFSELVDVNRLMFPRDGVTYQVSSYDRTGGNDDGFSGKNSFVRKEGENFVIFDEQGPGCIYRIWSANPDKGWVKFYFDGEIEPRIAVDKFEDLFKGEYQPFVKPLVANFLGGWNSYVPLPFNKSCKIVAQGPVRFLQITWRKFPDSEGVNTFTRDLSPEEKQNLDLAVAAWSKPGESPMPFSPACKTTLKNVSSASRSVKLAEMDGAGVVRALKLKVKSSDIRVLRKAVLQITTDGQDTPSVWSPIGDFFMTGFNGIETRGLLVGVKDAQMYSYWPMPYEKGIKIELVNDTGTKLDCSAELVYEPMQTLPKETLRFYAWWHRQNPTQNGQPFPMLEAKGSGHWCGVSHFMHGYGGLGFLEGDEMLWVDGRDNSHYNGTGTEDYFNSGWYFGTEGCQPLYGCTVHDDPGSQIHAYRIHLTDLVPFQKDARIVIEHGPGNDINADYAGVTYWYADSNTSHSFSSVPVSKRGLRPVKMRKVVEAESLFVSASGKVQLVDDVDLPLNLSDGRGVRFAPLGEDGRVTFRMGVNESAPCNVLAWLATGPSSGKAEALIDGKPSGIVIDTYSKTPKVAKFVVAKSSTMRTGEREISFVSRGKSKASSGHDILVDCLKLQLAEGIEAEELKVIASSEPLDVQLLEIFGVNWSNDAQFWFRASKPASFTLELPVEKSGKYHVYAYMTKAGDYGICRFKIDGNVVGQPLDAYNDGVIRSPKLDLGVMELSAGNHEVTVEVTGKSDKSSGYFAGLDCLILDPVR